MENALSKLNLACDTGNHVPFIHAMYLIFRDLPIEKNFLICLREAEICVRTVKIKGLESNLRNIVITLQESFSNSHSSVPKPDIIDLNPYKDSHLAYFIKAVNNLIEATTKDDIHWQRSLLEEAYHRMTIFRIIDYRLTLYPNSKHSETWNADSVIEYRKAIFNDFKRRYENKFL